MLLLRQLSLGGKGKCRKLLEGRLGHWGQALSPKWLGFATTHGAVPIWAVEGQPPHNLHVLVVWGTVAPWGRGFGGSLVLMSEKNLAWPHAGVALGMVLQGDMRQRK